jgi:hypothetical protein
MLACVAVRAQTPLEAMPTDRPAVHGMLVFGTHKIYAAHLPMFHAPHHYQVVVELALPKDVRRLYLRSLQSSDETAYTLAPQPFVLPQVLNATMDKKPRAFKAALFLGHFERGGRRITDSFAVKIARVVYARKLDAADTVRNGTAYFLLGTVADCYLVHRIGGRPGFDHVLRVHPPEDWFRANPLATDVFTLLYTPAGNAGRPLQQPAKDETKAAPATVAFTLPGFERPLQLSDLKQLYLEFSDLE